MKCLPKLVILLTILLVSVFVFSPTASAKDCSLLDSTFSVPAGFGACYNPLTSKKELLIKTDCGLDSVTVDIGNGSDYQYIYDKGYIYRNNIWEEITFSGPNPNGVWLRGNASLEIAMSQTELLNNNSLIAYICTWNGTKWKCGCRDAACTTSYWQLQMFKKQQDCPSDSDSDGYGNPASDLCANPELDCNDSDKNINPGASEICDGVDNNCNGITDDNCGCNNGDIQICGIDEGECQVGTQTCANGGWSACYGAILPSDEVCDGKDNDCDAQIDEGTNCCTDLDQDGYGAGPPNTTLPDCPNPQPDCDDSKWFMNPGAPETCDNYDNNCSVAIDEGCDDDNDGYCDSSIRVYNMPLNVCLSTNVPPDSFGDDCDDNNGKISPGAIDTCDSIDNNCDGVVDEDCDSEYPVVTAFDVQPRNTIDSITATFSVTDNKALDRVELWRAPDLNGSAGNWLLVNQTAVSGTQANGELADAPAAGIWWYGMHAVDKAGNMANEGNLGAKKITVTGQTACQDADFDGYDNCSPGQNGDDGKLKDCNDSSNAVNPGKSEVCNNNIDDNCNGQIDETCGSNDTVLPSVTVFDVQPRNTTDNVSVYYQVSDNIGLNRVELWRASDSGGAPGSWTQIKQTVVSSTQSSGFFTDTPPTGIWWYGIHVLDIAGNMADEGSLGPIKITAATPANCQDADFDGYDNCSPGQNGDDGKLKDCNDSSNAVNPGKSEVCNNNIDDNCNGQIDETCGIYDTVPPSVIAFDIQPRTSTGLITATWTVADDQALLRVELWRAPDQNDSPGSWVQVAQKTVSGTSASGEFNNTPSSGSWWYGLHVTDNAGNWIDEGTLGILKITITTISNCRDSDNDGYDNCAPGQVGDDGNKIDCDDNEYWASPGEVETCDTINNDCVGKADEGCDDDNDKHCDSNMRIYRSNSMCYNTPFSEGRNGDDCNDMSNIINPGRPEVCSNSVDDNCNGQIDETCGINDITPPQNVQFDVQPKTTTGTINASWAATDDAGLLRVELWRTSDSSGKPNSSNWALVQIQSVSGTYSSGSFTDTPPSGLSWYGLHVVDRANNIGYEKTPPGPIRIDKSGCTPDGCNNNCPADCGVYDDPDCGCLNTNSCCGIGCNSLTDNDCTTSLTVTITNPLDGAQFSEDISVIFQGIANGGQPGYNYSWSSSIDGFLGEGQTITIPK